MYFAAMLPDGLVSAGVDFWRRVAQGKHVQSCAARELTCVPALSGEAPAERRAGSQLAFEPPFEPPLRAGEVGFLSLARRAETRTVAGRDPRVCSAAQAPVPAAAQDRLLHSQQHEQQPPVDPPHASRPAVAELILLTASGPDLASERPRSESAGSHLQAT